MRFLTWNIQSGGGNRLPAIVREIEKCHPDFVALTEVTYSNLGSLRDALARIGFDHVETTSEEGRKNSVLVASKVPFEITSEPIAHDPERWISVELPEIRLKVLCVHIPGSTDNKFGSDGYGLSGKKRKELFWDQVIQYAQLHRDDKVVLLGDFNTGLPEDAQGMPFELSDRIRVLRLDKYADTWRTLNPNVREYTWYSKRRNKELSITEDFNGFRLDYIFVSNALRDSLVSAEHVHDVRTNSISDHALLFVDLALELAGADDPGGNVSPARRPPDYVKGWGELLRAHRIYMGISQRCLAERLDMSERSLSDIEVGRRDCPPGFLDAVEAEIKEFDLAVQEAVQAGSESARGVKHDLTMVEIDDAPEGEWTRAVVGRAAVMSGRLMPVRAWERPLRASGIES